ncbi:RNA polymerase sigma factor SigD [Bacillus coahuilensis p1.1.43]|uniref:RNA polymerase sigma factor SigD n=1 Tax=Bacillus coahuilensis p1.1.43 TaxID=1150625 RepID=A0A147K9M0_9BACI|nr:FliA/WhiG family RNA polymerase sigma factor [Bacillus coahuilensis]KUP07132.1 RNA polymerase sigma factor SigD [Bacillus coahuilensis p1.1.43]
MHVSTTQDELVLWKSWIENRNEEAGDLLVKKYMHLVSFHVQRISSTLPKNVSKDDLKSLGMMGLLDALQKFDIERDLKFDTYASFRIRGSIIDGLRKEDWLPRNTRDKAKKIEKTISRLEQTLMRKIVPEDVAKELDMSADEVIQIMNEHFFANVLSMDEMTREEEKDSPKFQMQDEKSRSPEEELVKSEQIRDLEQHIRGLNEKEQLVLSLFYQEELTLTEIGEVLQLSTSRISQIHSKALFKLRKFISTQAANDG